MKKYFVIFHEADDNSHINTQDLLPASCKLITGIAVNATVKQIGQLEEFSESLAFPQNHIGTVLAQDGIVNLFYSYLKTRPSEDDSRLYFETEMLPEIVSTLSQNIIYPALTSVEQIALEQRIANVFNNDFADYLYNDNSLYEAGYSLSSFEFMELVVQHILKFIYLKREDIFWRIKQQYERPDPFDCGNMSLLINGNSFLLRDFVVTANRKVRHMRKEIIPFYEPLEVNSSIHTVFKNNKSDLDSILTLRIYIEYDEL